MPITYRLVSKTTGKTAASRLTIAASFWSRLVGWQFRGKPTAGEGLLLAPCNAIHTCFVRFAMDVLFLDRGGAVLEVRRNLRPWRLAFGPRNSYSVIELLAGAAEVQPREVLRLEAGNRGEKPPKAAAFLFD